MGMWIRDLLNACYWGSDTFTSGQHRFAQVFDHADEESRFGDVMLLERLIPLLNRGQFLRAITLHLHPLPFAGIKLAPQFCDLVAGHVGPPIRRARSSHQTR